MSHERAQSREATIEAMHRLADAIHLHLAEGLDDGTTRSEYSDATPDMVLRESYVSNGESVLAISSTVNRDTGVATATQIEDVSMRATGLLVGKAVLAGEGSAIGLTDYPYTRHEKPDVALSASRDAVEKGANSANALAELLETGKRMTNLEIEQFKKQRRAAAFTEKESRDITRRNNRKGAFGAAVIGLAEKVLGGGGNIRSR